MTSDWAHIHLRDTDALCSHTVTGNGFALLANRISYLLDLKGPSLTVDAACSSSLLALHYAGQALRHDECDVAVAASVNAIITPTLQRFYERAGLAALDGRCKPFSVQADGIGRGEGVGAVVLQRQSEAAHCYAHLRGSAVNHNGRSNGLTAPNRHAQRDVLEAAWRRAGITADDIDDIECHGTGTQIGDQIELRALNDVLAGRKAATSCRLGAVKALIGHTESAAGMAGLIKASLMLHHRHAPANPYAADAIPALRGAAPVVLSGASHDQAVSDTFVIGVSAFGLGGTNAHVVLEAASPPPVPDVRHDPCLIAFAGDADTVERQRTDLIRLLAESSAPLRDIATTVRHLRSAHPQGDAACRVAITASDRVEAGRKLAACRGDTDGGATPRRVVFMFSGQGSQAPGMGRGLARCFPEFRDSLRRSFEIVRQLGGQDIQPVFEDPASTLLTRASVAQPALFAYELAAADMWRELGVRPDAVIGHSIGEFAAACVAGAFDPTQCLRMLIARGALIDAHGGVGGMVSLHAGAQQIRAVLAAAPGLRIAVHNTPLDVVVAGDEAALAAALAYCARTGIRARRLPVTHGFHSPLMDPVAPLLADACAREVPAALRIPMLSTVTGCFLDTPPDAAYWARHLVAPVRFEAACRRLAKTERSWLGLELGPRPTLAPLAEKLIASGGVWLATASPNPDDTEPFLASIGSAWRLGHDIAWSRLHDADARHVPLAPYPFLPTRFWHRDIEAPAPVISVSPATETPVVGKQSEPELAAAVTAILATVIGIDPADIAPDDRLAEDLGLDSLNIIEVLSHLRNVIGEDKMPPLDELATVSTVAELICMLCLKTEFA
jgi:acyl carrier protein